MKRSEAFHILEEMCDFATETQRQAIGMAQNDIEFVDLMPDDMVAVVRCKDCKHMSRGAHGRYCYVWKNYNGMGDEGYCNYGERKEG